MKIIKAITPITHDGKSYTADSVPFEVADDQVDALIAVGAAKEVPPEADADKAPAKTPAAKK